MIQSESASLDQQNNQRIAQNPLTLSTKPLNQDIALFPESNIVNSETIEDMRTPKKTLDSEIISRLRAQETGPPKENNFDNNTIISKGKEDLRSQQRIIQNIQPSIPGNYGSSSQQSNREPSTKKVSEFMAQIPNYQTQFSKSSDTEFLARNRLPIHTEAFTKSPPQDVFFQDIQDNSEKFKTTNKIEYDSPASSMRANIEIPSNYRDYANLQTTQPIFRSSQGVQSIRDYANLQTAQPIFRSSPGVQPIRDYTNLQDLQGSSTNIPSYSAKFMGSSSTKPVIGQLIENRDNFKNFSETLFPIPPIKITENYEQFGQNNQYQQPYYYGPATQNPQFSRYEQPENLRTSQISEYKPDDVKYSSNQIRTPRKPSLYDVQFTSSLNENYPENANSEYFEKIRQNLDPKIRSTAEKYPENVAINTEFTNQDLYTQSQFQTPIREEGSTSLSALSRPRTPIGYTSIQFPRVPKTQFDPFSSVRNTPPNLGTNGYVKSVWNTQVEQNLSTFLSKKCELHDSKFEYMCSDPNCIRELKCLLCLECYRSHFKEHRVFPFYDAFSFEIDRSVSETLNKIGSGQQNMSNMSNFSKEYIEDLYNEVEKEISKTMQSTKDKWSKSLIMKYSIDRLRQVYDEFEQTRTEIFSKKMQEITAYDLQRYIVLAVNIFDYLSNSTSEFQKMAKTHEDKQRQSIFVIEEELNKLRQTFKEFEKIPNLIDVEEFKNIEPEIVQSVQEPVQTTQTETIVTQPIQEVITQPIQEVITQPIQEVITQPIQQQIPAQSTIERPKSLNLFYKTPGTGLLSGTQNQINQAINIAQDALNKGLLDKISLTQPLTSRSFNQSLTRNTTQSMYIQPLTQSSLIQPTTAQSTFMQPLTSQSIFTQPLPTRTTSAQPLTAQSTIIQPPVRAETILAQSSPIFINQSFNPINVNRPAPFSSQQEVQNLGVITLLPQRLITTSQDFRTALTIPNLERLDLNLWDDPDDAAIEIFESLWLCKNLTQLILVLPPNISNLGYYLICSAICGFVNLQYLKMEVRFVEGRTGQSYFDQRDKALRIIGTAISTLNKLEGFDINIQNIEGKLSEEAVAQLIDSIKNMTNLKRLSFGLSISPFVIISQVSNKIGKMLGEACFLLPNLCDLEINLNLRNSVSLMCFRFVSELLSFPLHLQRLRILFTDSMEHGTTNEELILFANVLRQAGALQEIGLQIQSPQSDITDEGILYLIDVLKGMPLRRVELGFSKPQGSMLSERVRNIIKGTFVQNTLILV